MGFRCQMCDDLKEWADLFVLHELNYCGRCRSTILTNIKQHQERQKFNKDEVYEPEYTTPITNKRRK